MKILILFIVPILIVGCSSASTDISPIDSPETKVESSTTAPSTRASALAFPYDKLYLWCQGQRECQ